MKRSATVIRRVYQISNEREKGFGYQVNEALRLGCEVLNMENGVLSKIKNRKYTIMHAIAPLAGFEEGQDIPLHKLFCDRVANKKESVAIPDAAATPQTSTHSSYRELGTRSYIGAPILVNEEIRGTLNFSGREAHEPFTDEETDIVNFLAQWISRGIERLKNEKEMVEAARKMQVLVKFDSLTGMYSRSSIEGRLKRLLQRRVYTSEPISAAVVDIDDFSKIDLRYGKTGADMAITAVAQAIDDAVRPTDLSARIGDDEFLVILVGANEKQAKMVSKRIQAQIAENHIEVSGAKIPLSASIAVTELSDEVSHIEEILKDTHARLVVAKQEGKSKIL